MRGFETISTATTELTIDAPVPKPVKQELPENTGWDDTHKSIFAAMAAAGAPPVLEMLDGKPVAKLHTCALLADFKTNRRAGRYSTTSAGRDLQEPNAFAFPLPNGGLDVYRYQDAAESEDWHTTANGKSRIRYNVPVSFEEAVKATGKFDRRGTAILRDPDELFRLLGIPLQIPELLAGREVTVRRDARSLLVTVPGDRRERNQVLPGWRYYRGQWEHDLPDCLRKEDQEMYEHCVRQVTDEYKAQTWVIKDDRGCWKDQSLAAAKTFIKGFGHSEFEIAHIVQHHMRHNYQLARIPFGPEELPGRIWNRFGAKLACLPVKGRFPHIQQILDHVGHNLDSAVQEHEWCRQYQITTGAAYLELWAAIVFRHPERRLPGMFAWSEVQNIGKSTYGRMLTRGFLGCNGWCQLRKELTRDDFNDQMRGAVLCLLEELDLSVNFQAYQLVKDYIDNPYLKVRGMYNKAETETNYTHFFHTANHRHFCPVYPGDTRIVMFRVDPFTEPDMDWATKLRPLVDTEMAAFLYHVLNEIELPPAAGRLYLPVLETQDKREAMAERQAEMEGWYGQLREFAFAGLIEERTASDILKMLVEATNDPKLPKTAAAFAQRLNAFVGRLKADGLALTCMDGDKKRPSTYTIKATSMAF